MSKSIYKTLLESTTAPAHYQWHEFTHAFGLVGSGLTEFLEDYMELTVYSMDSFFNNYETPLELIETYPTKFFKALHDCTDLEYKDIILRLGEIL